MVQIFKGKITEYKLSADGSILCVLMSPDRTMKLEAYHDGMNFDTLHYEVYDKDGNFIEEYGDKENGNFEETPEAAWKRESPEFMPALPDFTETEDDDGNARMFHFEVDYDGTGPVMTITRTKVVDEQAEEAGE